MSKRRNHRKPLKIVLIVIIVAAIFAGIWTAVYFATREIIAATAPATADQLYEKVQTYDYSNGHSEEIESDIKRLLDESNKEETSTNYAKTLKAKAEYYYGLQKYYTAVTTFKEFEDYVINGDDMIYVTEHLADAYAKFGNEELAAKYQEQYDNLTRKCGGDSGSASEENNEEGN